MHALHVCNWVNNERLTTSNSILKQQSYPQHVQKIYRGLSPPWRRTGAYCVQHSAVLLLVLVLLGCECQTEQFPGSALAYTYEE